MLRAGLIVTLLLIPLAASAQDHTVPADIQDKIITLLGDMQCEIDPGNIEAEDDGGYELDDVFCADGQYDIDLDAELQITNKKKE